MVWQDWFLIALYIVPAVVAAVKHGFETRGYPNTDGSYPFVWWKCVAEGIAVGLLWPYFAWTLFWEEL